MKVSCNEGIASHVGPESCGEDRKVLIEALTGESAGRVWSLENVTLWGADDFASCGRQQRSVRYGEGRTHPTWSKTPCTHRSISRGSREIQVLARHVAGPRRESERSTTAMNGPWKSDEPIVPAKLANNRCCKADQQRAEPGGGKGLGRGERGRRRLPPCWSSKTDRSDPVPSRGGSTPLRRSAPCAGAGTASKSARILPARYHPRQEPGAVVPLAGICAGGGGQPPSLPRLQLF
jgi:hypothetical protein